MLKRRSGCVGVVPRHFSAGPQRANKARCLSMLLSYPRWPALYLPYTSCLYFLGLLGVLDVMLCNRLARLWRRVTARHCPGAGEGKASPRCRASPARLTRLEKSRTRGRASEVRLMRHLLIKGLLVHNQAEHLKHETVVTLWGVNVHRVHNLLGVASAWRCVSGDRRVLRPSSPRPSLWTCSASGAAVHGASAPPGASGHQRCCHNPRRRGRRGRLHHCRQR